MGGELNKFCTEEIEYDPECFHIRTKGGSVKSLWALWDTNNDKYLDTKEYRTIEDSMDLNADGKLTELETKAYFIRNKFIVCKPYSNFIKKAYTNK
jgi:hypothetical protein